MNKLILPHTPLPNLLCHFVPFQAQGEPQEGFPVLNDWLGRMKASPAISTVLQD